MCLEFYRTSCICAPFRWLCCYSSDQVEKTYNSSPAVTRVADEAIVNNQDTSSRPKKERKWTLSKGSLTYDYSQTKDEKKDEKA